MNKLMVGILMLMVVLVGCSGGADYTTSEFEEALNNGENVEGKTVEVEVREMENNSAFGYNMIAGDHLNFTSTINPEVEEGDTVTIKVEKVASMLGSFIITYEE